MPFEVLILICLKWLYETLFELFRFYGGDSLQEHFRLFQIFFCIRFFQKMLWTRFFLLFFFICFWIVVLYFGLVFRILCHWRTHWVSTSGAVRTSLVERTLNCRITLVGFNDGLCHYDYFFLLPVLTHSFLFLFFWFSYNHCYNHVCCITALWYEYQLSIFLKVTMFSEMFPFWGWE